MFQASLPSAAAEIFKRMLQGPSQQQYTPQLRAFALTLHFYSPKAYNYVREKFNDSLPHPDTISRWYRAIDGSPGFTTEALTVLKMKKAELENSGQKMLCNLVMDEMSIMRKVEWTGQKFTGFVDIGADVFGDNLPEAKDVVVFLLVALNGHWKIPVGYFFVDGLQGQEKANLVCNLLKFLQEAEVIVTSFTFDGAPANLRMAEVLGANLKDPQSLVPYFHHPVTNEKIFIFLDLCHMLKLWRNCLGDSNIQHLEDYEGNMIHWRYFKNLVELQNVEGLHAATKIRNRHINFFSEKQKVKLAAQTFSNSVADALVFLEEDLGLVAFKGASATAEFCRVANNLFDIFNTRVRYSKALYKTALSPHSAYEMFSYLEYAKQYILGLKLAGTSVLLTNRKTGFIGFLIGIESLRGIYELYVASDTPLLKYILTYKFSQDHLEIFFSAVRSSLGSNNNPTARQFQSIYKKLLIHTEIKGSNLGNAIAMDSTTILHVSSINKTNMGEDLQNTEEYISLSNSLNEHDYIPSSAWHLTSYLHDVVAYIAGFVVRCLKKCVTCENCLDLLESEETLSLLQRRKAYGVLNSASVLVINICKTGEKYLRIYMAEKGIFNKKNISEILITGTVRNLDKKYFDIFSNHTVDMDPMNDHSLQLSKLILKHYFKVRIHHESAKCKDLSENRIRSLLTKTILFKHQ